MSEPILDLQPHYLCYDVVEYIIELCFDPYTPCVCSLVCKSWNEMVNDIRSRHQRRSEKVFNERYVSRYKARQALSLSQKNDIDRQLYKLLASQLDYWQQNFNPAAVRSLLDQGATTCLFNDYENSPNLGDFVDKCLEHYKWNINRENGFKVLIDICCSYSREWCCNRRYVSNGGEWLSSFVLRSMASNTVWPTSKIPQGEEAIKLKRYVSRVLDSMHLSILASKIVEPDNTIFTEPDKYRLFGLINSFVFYITYPQSREERFMVRRFLSYTLNTIDMFRKYDYFSKIFESELQDYIVHRGRYKPIDPMALEWIFKVFIELGYSNYLYLIVSCDYYDLRKGLVTTKSLNWSKFLYSRGSRRALSKLVETHKEVRLSILLDDNGTWWKILVRDKNRHLLKRLQDLEKESFNTSEILEYAKSKEVKGKKERLIEMLETLESADK
ncbi:hypothetical protein GQ42DRAFT_68001 [Ramicandelaber brevisporus]|nr:hypothetical protein GQ42DRAFT_68001 [Ramicandelaber brevisporus]